MACRPGRTVGRSLFAKRHKRRSRRSAQQSEELRGLAAPIDWLRTSDPRVMAEVVVALAASRQVLGPLNDFAYLLGRYDVGKEPLLEVSLGLAKAA